MVNQEAQVWFNRGNEQYDRGDFEGAIAFYDKAIEIKPDFYKAWNNRGLALGSLGRIEDEFASYDQAIKFKPGCHQAWNNRGLVLEKLWRIEEAIASYDQAIEFKPDFHEAWNNRGIALGKSRDFKGAIACFKQALFIKSDNHEACNNRGITLVKLGDLENAIACFDQALVIKPDDHKIWNNRGIALAHLEKWETAITSFNQALAIKSDYHEAWNNRGILLCDQLGRYEEASVSFNQALIIKPDYYDAWYNRGIALGQLEDVEGAINSFCKALAIKPDYYDSLNLEKTAIVKQLQRDRTDLFRRFIAKTQNPIHKEKLQYLLVRFQPLTVDMLLHSEKWIEALETAEEGKNTCLSWLFSDNSSPKYPEIKQLVNPATAVIYWHLSPYALHTFIIKYGETTPIVIGLETESLTRLDEFEEWVKKWNQEYAQFGKGEKQQGGAQTWRDNLEETLKELGEILNIAAIVEEVRGINNLILIPHRDLHRFPIHALFGDEFTVSYLPSAKIGINLVKANDLDNKPQTPPVKFNPNGSPQPIAKTVLSLENPHSTYKDGDRETRYPPLPAADIESEMICQMFANSIRIGENDLTRDRAIAELQKPYNILHFTGHGSYEFFDPQKSALFLSGSDRLTVREIISIDLSSYELICLSACETAITGNQTITTEYVGLVSAFMAAKAKYVLSTLWPVQSAASALLVIYFYQQLQAGHPEAAALAIAQKWLRDATREDLAAWCQAEIDKQPSATIQRFFKSSRNAINTIELNQPYQHPYYWAAFILTGL